MCGCELVCPVVPRPPLCICRSDPLYRFPTDLHPPHLTQKKRVPHKGNNKPDLRENRILQWHFEWKKMTRQSNGGPTRGVLPSEADQYKVSSRAQTYRHSIPIYINSCLIFSLSHDIVPMAMCLNTLMCSGYYTYHLL